MPGFKARWEPMESILERAIGSSERMGSLGFSAGSKETGEHETKVPIFFLGTRGGFREFSSEERG